MRTPYQFWLAVSQLLRSLLVISAENVALAPGWMVMRSKFLSTTLGSFGPPRLR